jgi:hypothetical protein
MAFTSVGPGTRSLVGLGWLVRVGPSPVEPLAAVMGWSERVAHDHVRRLTTAGLVRREQMRQGSGSLVMATSRGAIEAGFPARTAPRSIGPTNWAYACACAWVGAWLQRRGSVWWGERQVGADDFWRWSVRYNDRRGMHRVTHRPALGLRLGHGYGAVEVETRQRLPQRLLGTMRMYEELTDSSDASSITGVLFVTSNEVIADQVRRAAAKACLHEPKLKLRSLAEVTEQASTGDFGFEQTSKAALIEADQ